MQSKDFQSLRECPFCGGESFVATVEHSEESRPNGYRFHGQIMCRRCQATAGTTGFDSTYEEATRKAIVTWNRRAQPENKPLTLDELRQMEGEPAFVTPINLHEWICNPMDGKPEWGMVRKSWVRIWRSETADLTHTDFDFEDYGKTWLAYRHKPERSE